MIITIVTLHRGHSAEQYVGAVQGKLNKRERNRLKARYKVAEDDENDEPDNMCFREIEVADASTGLDTLWNVDGDNDAVIKDAGPLFEFQLKQTAE